MARRGLCLILAGLLVWLAAAPALALSVAEEEKLGRKFMIAMRGQMEFIHDPVLLTYLDRVGRSLAERYETLAYRPSFLLANDEKLNAFAAPGGVLVFSRGLLEQFDDVDELAGVMAHELAHASRRHLAEINERMSKLQWAALAGMVAAALVGLAAGNVDLGMGLAMGTMAGVTTSALAYTREQETDADQVGIKKMTEAGYDPRGSLEALQKLKLASDISEMAAPAYLSTHPGILDRIAFLSAIKSDRPAGTISPNGPDWPWFRVRLAVLSGRRNLLKNLSEPLAEYAQALTNLESGRNQEALAGLTKLHQAEPQRLGLAESLAEALLRVGRPEEAVRTLETTLAQRPDNPGGLLLLGRVQMERGKSAEAIRSFKELQRLWPYDPQVWRQLSIAYGRAGELAKAHTHLAQAFVLLGDRGKALQNYDLALREAKSPEERGQIETERKEALGLLPPPTQQR